MSDTKDKEELTAKIVGMFPAEQQSIAKMALDLLAEEKLNAEVGRKRQCIEMLESQYSDLPAAMSFVQELKTELDRNGQPVMGIMG